MQEIVGESRAKWLPRSGTVVHPYLGVGLTDPEPVPAAADDAGVISSDVPVVVQHTRLDSRQPADALLSTIAFPA
jgi:hypothetical protein